MSQIGLASAALGSTLVAGGAAQAQPVPRPDAAPAITPRQETGIAPRIDATLLHDAASPVLGNPHGDVTMVEFFDYRCPCCKVMAPRVAALIRSDPGLRVVMKEYPVLGQWSVMLLQQWYGLSDEAVYEALADRLRFRRFCGYSLDEDTPDDTTLCRFRADLGPAGLTEPLLAEVQRQVDVRGLVLKRGTIVDAKLIAAAVAPPTPREGQVTARDPEAAVAARRGRAVYGYKAHVAANAGTGLVRDVIVNSADIHDTLACPALVQGDEAEAYADRAYDSARNRGLLAAAGIADGIMHRARRNRPLRPWQRWHNRTLAPVRGDIERVFGTWKRSWGLRLMRYRGLRRNEAHLHLVAAAWNLLRAASLSAV